MAVGERVAGHRTVNDGLIGYGVWVGYDPSRANSVVEEHG
jgi:hypothetical protein